MKKIITLVVALVATLAAKAQMHGDMAFIGSSTFSASTATQDNLRDTVKVGDGNTSVTLPVMTYKAMNMVLPSIKFVNLKYAMTGSMATGNMAFVWHQEYQDTVIVLEDGVTEKHLKNVDLTVKYAHAAGELTVDATFQYGNMPFPLHYVQTGYYTKENAWNLVGRGTEANPYKIYDTFDLQQMAENINSENNGNGEHFLMMSDIDFENNTFAPIGQNTAFAGIFDGNNKAITNLATNNAKPTYADIFGDITEEAAIKDLTINGNVADAIESVAAEQADEQPAYKVIRNGKLVIIRNNKEYNAAGANQ